MFLGCAALVCVCVFACVRMYVCACWRLYDDESTEQTRDGLF